MSGALGSLVTVTKKATEVTATPGRITVTETEESTELDLRKHRIVRVS